MSKKTGLKGMHHGGGTKRRGRTLITPTNSASPTRPNVLRTLKVEANRPVEAGGTKHRGDRRDTSRTYTGNQPHASRGSNARPDVKTRKR